MSLSIVSPFSSVHGNQEFSAFQTKQLLLSAGVGAFVGGSIGAATVGPIGLAVGLAVGAVAGIVACVAVKHFSKAAEDSGISTRDLQWLITLSTDPRLSQPVKVSIEKIKTFLSKSSIFVAQAFELHEMHNELITVSRSIAERRELKKEWILFLHKLHGKDVKYPDGSIHPIETDLAIKAVNKVKVDVSIEQFDPNSSCANREIEAIYKLEEECFTVGSRSTLEGFAQELRSPLSFCYLAKDQSSSKLLGILWGRWEMDDFSRPFLHVCGLGRKASAAKLGIAENLMSALQKYQKATGLPCVLEVRASNSSAQRLYEKWGYERIQQIPHYYKKPDESAYLMRRSFVAARVA